MTPTHPDEHTEAQNAVGALHSQVSPAQALAERAKGKVLNSMMGEALNTGPDLLGFRHPKVDEDLVHDAVDAPYDFAVATEEYALVVRVAGALNTMLSLLERLDNKLEGE